MINVDRGHIEEGMRGVGPSSSECEDVDPDRGPGGRTEPMDIPRARARDEGNRHVPRTAVRGLESQPRVMSEQAPKEVEEWGVENRDHNPAVEEPSKTRLGKDAQRSIIKTLMDAEKGRPEGPGNGIGRHPECRPSQGPREVHNVERQKRGTGASPRKAGEARTRSPKDIGAGVPRKATGDKGPQVEGQRSATQP